MKLSQSLSNFQYSTQWISERRFSDSYFATRPSTALLSAILITLTLFTNTSFAKESDAEQPIEYYNDGNATIRNQDGMRVTSISDNVRIIQGSMEITGNFAKLEFDLETDELQKITIEGTPATYQQELDDESVMNGESDTIFYFATGEVIVEFVGNAIFQQQGNTMNCAAVKHYLETEFTDNTGPCRGVFPKEKDEDTTGDDTNEITTTN